MPVLLIPQYSIYDANLSLLSRDDQVGTDTATVKVKRSR